MGIVVRQSIKSIAVTFAGVLLGGLVTVLFARFFTKADYGFTRNLTQIAFTFSYLGLFGFNATLLIFGQKYPPGHPARGTFLSLCVFFPLLFSLMVCAAYFIFRDRFLSFYNAADARMLQRYLVLFPLLTFFTVLVSWMESYLQSLHKTALQSFAREVLLRVGCITLIILFALKALSFSVFLWLYVLLYLTPFAFLLWIAWRAGGLVFEFKKGMFSVKEVKEILRFSGYQMLTVIGYVLIMQLDIILLGPLAKDGLEAVAVYSIAVLCVSMIRNPTRVIGLAATPTFTQHYQDRKIKALRDLFNRSALNMQLFAVGMFLLVYLNINSIEYVMSFIKEGYGAIKALILILMIGQLADMVTGLNYELIGVTKYYRFNFWIAVGLLALVFPLNYFLIKAMGINGAAWATTIGLVVFNIVKTVFLRKKLKMQPLQKKTFLIVIAGLLAGGIAWLIPVLGNVFLDVTLRSGVFILIFWSLSFKLKISQELNELTINIIKKRKFY
jgi:O-antigen/teichoic acid export membrane protein